MRRAARAELARFARSPSLRSESSKLGVTKTIGWRHFAGWGFKGVRTPNPCSRHYLCVFIFCSKVAEEKRQPLAVACPTDADKNGTPRGCPWCAVLPPPAADAAVHRAHKFLKLRPMCFLA